MYIIKIYIFINVVINVFLLMNYKLKNILKCKI